MDGITDDREVGSDATKPVDIDQDGIPDILDSFNDLHYAESQALDAEVQKLLLAAAKTTEKLVPVIPTDIATPQAPKSTDTDATAPDSDKLTVEAIEGKKSDAFQPSRLYFPSNSPDPIMTTEASNYFDDVVTWMMRSNDNNIVLTGHTDATGPRQANLALGIRRVMVIREVLLNKGAPIQQIDIMSRGESQPLFDNRTKIGRLKNRRVEIAPME
jgi:outer membrane protein OmpA-like peptidoglycan-associated protein